MSSAARSRAGVPVAVTGIGVVSPHRQRPRQLRRGALRRPLGRAGARSRPSRHRRSGAAGRRGRLRCRRRDRAVARAARSRHGDGAGRRRRRRRATPASSPAASMPSGSASSGAAAWPAPPTFETTCRTVYAERRRMRPTSVVTAMPNAPVAEIALRFGARGAALAYACACASSAVAIGEAMRAIRAGWIDVAIAGGSESLLTPGVLASWQAMRVLAPLAVGADREASAQRACRPFAADRAGFALGEAAAAFILESTDAGACTRRGASLRPRRLCDQLRRRPHHPARRRRASAGDAVGPRRRGPVGRRDRLPQRPRHGDDGRRRRRGRIDRAASSARTACR